MSTPDDVLRSLRDRLGAPVGWVWTENRAVYLSLRPGAGSWTLRVHRSFRDAPAPVWAAVERFLRTGDRRCLGPARAHFEAGRAQGEGAPRRASLRPRGRVHHLGEILAEVTAHRHFRGLPPVPITWGRRARPGLRHVRLGSYRQGSPGAPPLIRVHPVLDDPRVPRYVVAQVVHHELAHHCLTQARGERQGRAHGPAFRELAGAFPDHARAQAWQDRHLAELLSGGGRRGRRAAPGI